MITRGVDLLPAHGRAGARATLLFLAAHFAKQNTKFGGGKARAGKNSFPQTPFLFARPSENYQKSASGFSRKKVRILFKTDTGAMEQRGYDNTPDYDPIDDTKIFDNTAETECPFGTCPEETNTTCPVSCCPTLTNSTRN